MTRARHAVPRALTHAAADDHWNYTSGRRVSVDELTNVAVILRMNVEDRRTVGARIKARRGELGLSQRDIACEGVSPGYLSRVERGDRAASMKVLRKIAPQLRVSVHWLETGREDPAEELALLVLAHEHTLLPPRATELARRLLESR